jgi:soluble lytic murein transglycosylase-like protein
MQVMPATAKKLGVKDPDTLISRGAALAVGQRYIEQLLNSLDGNHAGTGRRPITPDPAR